MTIHNIIDVIHKNHPEADTSLLELAYEYAENAHAGQKRMNGTDYIAHPLATTMRLAQMNFDMPTIIAGILHDIPEDTSRTLEDIEKNFGEEIAMLVSGITKLGKIKYRGLTRYAENLRKMFVAMAEDIRVVFIKFADRLDNLKSLNFLPPVKQQRIARETLEIYAPIANRLGMGELKGELEDLSFPFVYPEEYTWVKEVAEKKYEERKKYTQQIIRQVEKELKENSTVKVEKIEGRAKHYYSLYQKLMVKDRDIDKIYDLVAARIIVQNIDDCYHTLGHIHKLWTPVPGRIKDYIAQPKPNGYQSLHTTVYGDDGRIVEFQIRTLKMHEEAEYGIAAHWSFKESSNTKARIPVPQEKLKWIKELLEEQKKITSPKRYLKSLKLDFFKNRIFVFTPKGDVVDLPENATPVDFAYYIHTNLGHKCAGAKINDTIATLSTALKNGDVVEIVVDKNKPGPSEGWLSFVQTYQAKHRIKEYFNKQRKLNIFRFFSK
ncbi:MAG TPA: RelA/SpoT family protein [bacterium]|nr:RelA/SpoT family protein [bacterium]